MRLQSAEIDTIIRELRQQFGACRVYLFGSRLDEEKRGRDIDLYVIAEDMPELFKKRLYARNALQRLLHKPVDIVVHRKFDRPIEQEALKGIRLL